MSNYGGNCITALSTGISLSHGQSVLYDCLVLGIHCYLYLKVLNSVEVSSCRESIRSLSVPC